MTRQTRPRLTRRRIAWLRQLAVSESLRTGWGRVGSDCWRLGWSRWKADPSSWPQGLSRYEVITPLGLAVLALFDQGAECTEEALKALPGAPR